MSVSEYRNSVQWENRIMYSSPPKKDIWFVLLISLFSSFCNGLKVAPRRLATQAGKERTLGNNVEGGLCNNTNFRIHSREEFVSHFL